MADMICSSLLPTTLSSEGGGGGGGSSSAGGGGGSLKLQQALHQAFQQVLRQMNHLKAAKASGGGAGFAVGGGKRLLCTLDSSASSDGLEGLSLKNLSVSYFPTLGTIQIIGGSGNLNLK